MLGPLPEPPSWRSTWDAYQDRWWVQRLRGCAQSPVHHAEGDVWVHTGLVLEALTSLTAFRSLPEQERAVVFTAALLHDAAKPWCTREGPGGITAAGHSRSGSILARELLWRAGAPARLREQVAALVAFHMAPFWLIEEAEGQRRLLQLAQTARCDLLALHSEADARGRICLDQQRLLDNVELFREMAGEHGVVERPFEFASDHSRVVYFRKGGDPHRKVFESPRVAVTVMSGLPASGKDTWIRRHLPDLPCISLDDLREELQVDPGENQAAVVGAARERAREYLRGGRSFVWNATNLSRDMRGRCLSLIFDYSAAAHIVYLEAAPEEMERRNQSRSRPVPQQVLKRMLRRWEVPDLSEAHQVDWGN